MISYAQNREDVLLARFFCGDPPQFYVDVGAGHPTFHSVTRHFYEQGWRGIHFEPRRHLFDLLVRERPGDKCFPCALSSESGSLVFYTVNVAADTSGDGGGLSTLDPALAKQYREMGFEVLESQVDVRRLQDVLEEENVGEIGYLKIDVEGFELQVVQGLDWQRWRPRVVVMEDTLPMTDKRTDGKADLWVESQGYLLANWDGLNSYYVRAEDAERIDRLAAPVSVFDPYQTYEQQQQNEHLVDTQIQLKSVKEINADLVADLARVRSESAAVIEALQREVAENIRHRDESAAVIEGLQREAAGNIRHREESAAVIAGLQREVAENVRLRDESAAVIGRLQGELAENVRLRDKSVAVIGRLHGELAESVRLRDESVATIGRLQGELTENIRLRDESASMIGRLQSEIAERGRLHQESMVVIEGLRREIATPFWKRVERAIRARRRAAQQSLKQQLLRILG